MCITTVIYYKDKIMRHAFILVLNPVRYNNKMRNIQQ